MRRTVGCEECNHVIISGCMVFQCVLCYVPCVLQMSCAFVHVCLYVCLRVFARTSVRACTTVRACLCVASGK